MSIVLIISTIFLCVGFFICFFGEDPDFGYWFICIAVLIGFGIFGLIIPVNEDLTKVKNYEIVKTPYRVIVDCEYGYKSFSDMKYMNISKDDIIVYDVTNANSYGMDIYKDLGIKVEFKE